MIYDGKRIEELTNEVEQHLTFVSIKDEKQNMWVYKHSFLNTLVDIKTYSDSNGEIVYHMGFLNKYINTAFFNSYRKVENLISREEYFQMTYLLIADHLNNLENEMINISFKKNEKSEVNYIVFKIETEGVNSVLEQSGFYYNRDRQEGNKYMPKFENPIRIDDIVYDIGENEVLGLDSLSEEDYENIDKILGNINLTERQKEVLHTLVYCNNNISETGRELKIAKNTVREHLESIRNKFNKNNISPKQKKEKKNTMNVLDEILDDKDFCEEMLLKYLEENIGDGNIDFLVHEVEPELRKSFIIYIRQEKNKRGNISEIEPFLKSLLNIYYNQVKK